MVHINFDSRYAITSDKFQWVLLKDGRPFWFFQNLENLLKSYLSLKIKGCNAKTMNELIECGKQQQEALHSLLTSFNFRSKLPILASGNKRGRK